VHYEQPEAVIQSQLDNLKSQDKMTPELTFKEPYFINFIGAKDYYSEADFVRKCRNFKQLDGAENAITKFPV
jgi:predicted nuclease of restriction endonuclease-like (RecB) superfamily